MPKKNIPGATMAQARVIYMLELARGSSHIASTRTPETLKRAITEVLEGFCQAHGLHALDVFLELLAQEVGQRGHREAAVAVSAFASGVDGQKKDRSRAEPAGKSPDLSKGKNTVGT
ncbi:hypothetical protein P3T43_006278 [Paraburkholderia sp. GAS41]|jgi:hypothetical protein|uniref:hypothetical protein n=1 Tax=Paraburkholderia sp. GAS41 TaxID=3035134 RepID=UPI003D225840